MLGMLHPVVAHHQTVLLLTIYVATHSNIHLTSTPTVIYFEVKEWYAVDAASHCCSYLTLLSRECPSLPSHFTNDHNCGQMSTI